MKNQYFGDINDYRKYGLLRCLQSAIEGSCLVVWMLTPDDNGRDGGFRSYLRKPDDWARYDRELFLGLARLLQDAPAPAVSLIEAARLLPSTAYYSDVVPDTQHGRYAWRRGLLDVARNVDLVFVDPDNGVEIASKAIGRKGSSKFVGWTEVQALWQSGSSVLIYQHFPRKARQAFAEHMVSELRERTGAPLTMAFRTPHVLFLLAVQQRHELGMQNAIRRLEEGWKGQIDVLELNNPASTDACQGKSSVILTADVDGVQSGVKQA